MDNINYYNSNSSNLSDNSQQLVPTSSSNPQTLNNPLKRTQPDFQQNMDGSSNGGNKNSKRPKIVLPTNLHLNLNNTLLSSPDLNKLMVSTPEIEKFIMQNVNCLQTPTPTSVLFNVNPTEEQEQYVKGFVDALNEVKTNAANAKAAAAAAAALPIKSESEDTFDMTRCSSNSSSATYTTLDSSNPFPNNSSFNVSSYEFNDFNSSDGSLHIKDEPSLSITSASPPPVSPVDMDLQEAQKLERKRRRNRIAASKCRKRKLERIAKLEVKVQELKSANSDLAVQALKLKQEVCSLKEQVLEHANHGCQINIRMCSSLFVPGDESGFGDHA